MKFIMLFAPGALFFRFESQKQKETFSHVFDFQNFILETTEMTPVTVSKKPYGTHRYNQWIFRK
jgi:hypothetical protein